MVAKRIKGNSLHPDDQRLVLRAFIYRFTGDNTPQWARDGGYKVQFADDSEWLANTTFAVRTDGRLDRRYKRCESSPTWPDGRAKG